MSKMVLIVEDNELNMKLFHDLLEAHGYDTIETKYGPHVLDLARQHQPDLILMDIQLPEVSGLDVTKWLKADDELKSIPVIAVTAFAMKGDIVCYGNAFDRVSSGSVESHTCREKNFGGCSKQNTMKIDRREDREGGAYKLVFNGGNLWWIISPM